MEDVLPGLPVLQKKQMKFDHVHMNAVIFHLPPEYTEDVLKTVHSVLNNNGTYYLSLRHGPTDPERPMFEINKEDLFVKGKELFKLLAEADYKSDGRNRPGISWDRLIFRKI